MLRIILNFFHQREFSSFPPGPPHARRQSPRSIPRPASRGRGRHGARPRVTPQMTYPRPRTCVIQEAPLGSLVTSVPGSVNHDGAQLGTVFAQFWGKCPP